jgi:hypothetical protein
VSEELIAPDAIPIPEVNVQELQAAAAGLKTDGSDIDQAGQDITSTWAGLQAVYSAPEAETLFAAVSPVSAKGDDAATAMKTAAQALETFAEAAQRIRGDLYAVRGEARDFLASIEGDEDWNSGQHAFDVVSEKGQQHDALLASVNRLLQEYQEAERECANAITATFGGTTFIGGNSEGTTEPGAGEAVYGLDEPLENVETPWGTPQGTDNYWSVDAALAAWDVVRGGAEDLGGMVGAHGDQGWFSGDWSDNAEAYWGDALVGLGAMAGVYNPETNDWVSSVEEGFQVGLNARIEAVHGFFPWTELGENPGYAYGTLGTNLAIIGAGAALSATGGGAVVGIPLAASRGVRILGGIGGGDGPHSSGGADDGNGADGGSQNNSSNGNAPEAGVGGTVTGSSEAPDGISADGEIGASGIGSMKETVEALEATQNHEASPASSSDSGTGPSADHSPAPASPSSDGPASTDHGTSEGTSSQGEDTPESTGTPDQSSSEGTLPDPTTEEANEAFAEIERHNQDLSESMDAIEDDHRAELNGEAPWTLNALEDSGSSGRGDGPHNGDDESRVLVTPDGMEMRADGTINNSVDGTGSRLDEGSDPVTVHEDDRNVHRSGGNGGTTGSGASGGGWPENPSVGPDLPPHNDGPPTSESGTITPPDNFGGQGRTDSEGDASAPPPSGESDVVRQATNGPVTIDRNHPLRPLPKEPLGVEFPLEPNTTYEIPDSPDRPGATYYTDETGRIAEVHTEFGRPGKWNPDLRYPLPNVTYKIGNDLSISTDSLGRPSRVEGNLSLSNAPRGADQTPTGHLGRDEHTDYNNRAEDELAENLSDGDTQKFEDAEWDGGHLIANEFGGGGERINMIPMLRTLNRGNGAEGAWEGSWREMEKYWERLLSDDPSTSIQVSIEIEYPDNSSISNIPERIGVNYSVNGGEPVPRTFENLPLPQRSND